jgi:cobalamin biosynthesis protein CobT
VDTPEKKLKQALRTVTRMVYTMSALSGHQSPPRVAFGSGKEVNSVKVPTVYLDPNIVLKPKKGWDDKDLIDDVLCGDAIIATTLKYNVDSDVLLKAFKKAGATRELYISSEFASASQIIEHEAPGFKPYVSARVDYRRDEDFLRQVEPLIQFGVDPHPAVAVRLLRYSLEYPGNVNFEDYGPYAEGVQNGYDELLSTANSQERYEKTLEIIDRFLKIYPVEVPPPAGEDEQDQDDQDQLPYEQDKQDGDGEDDDNENDKSDDKSKDDKKDKKDKKDDKKDKKDKDKSKKDKSKPSDGDTGDEDENDEDGAEAPPMSGSGKKSNKGNKSEKDNKSGASGGGDDKDDKDDKGDDETPKPENGDGSDETPKPENGEDEAPKPENGDGEDEAPKPENGEGEDDETPKPENGDGDETDPETGDETDGETDETNPENEGDETDETDGETDPENEGDDESDELGEDGTPKQADVDPRAKNTAELTSEELDDILSTLPDFNSTHDLLEGKAETSEEVTKAVELSEEEEAKLSDVLGYNDLGMVSEHPTINLKMNQKSGDTAQYDQIVAQVAGQINTLRNNIQFRNEQPAFWEFGLRSGELDDNSLARLCMGEEHPPVFMEQTIMGRPGLGVGILGDESGSMGGGVRQPDGSVTTKAHEMQKVAIMLTEALNGIDGVDLSVFGHTGDVWSDGSYRRSSGLGHVDKIGNVQSDGNGESLIMHYVTPMTGGVSNKHSLAQMTARGNNYDGFAIVECAKWMREWYVHCQRRILFVVSDGQPAGSDYHGESALHHVRVACESARQVGIEVYGIGVANAFSQTMAETLYGPENYVILEDVETAGRVIGAFLTRVINRQTD